MRSMTFRLRDIARVLMPWAVCAGLYLGGIPAAAQSGVDCAVESARAGRDYDRVHDALSRGDRQTVNEARRAFWETEEYARNCPAIQKMAAALTESNLGRFPASAGPSGGGQQISSGGLVSATVVSVELLAQHGGINSGTSGAVGSSASGSTGSSGTGGSGMRYRITVHGDDGSTQVLTQDTAPNFRTGDRVRVIDGVVQRQE